MSKIMPVLFIGLLISCGGGNNENAAGFESMLLEDTEFENEGSVQIDRKLIKTAYLTYEVEDINENEKKLRQLTANANGYVTNENQFESKGHLNYSLEIKVPQSNFDDLMSKIAEGVEEFDERSVNVEDVTEEFIDIEARLITKKEIEQRFIELLDKAVSIGEILQIEQELKTIREEIESIEGRLKYLKSSVSYSTIHVTFYEQIPIAQHYGDQFKHSLTDGWKFFIYFLIAVLYLWPFFVVAGVIVLLVKRRKRKSTLKN
ncbi:MAG: DUF4349 domain-containing protein [Crocinitomicaceae bacterium]